MSADYSDELDNADCESLNRACKGVKQYGYEYPAVTRYSFYRRKGFNKADSMAFVRCWGRNVAEQATRRLGHDTGAQDWRSVG